jgi:hypothetical protein
MLETYRRKSVSFRIGCTHRVQLSATSISNGQAPEVDMIAVIPRLGGIKAALASGMDQGMEACYQKLEALLAQPV